jgi:hypothetical protein
MNQAIKLKMKELPQALSELMHSNQFLKLSAFSAYLLCGLLVTLLFYQAVKPTAVLTLTPDGSLYQTAPLPKPEVEIERAVREYIKYRYNWEPKTVAAKIDEAQDFILPATRKTFEASMANVVKFSMEKLVAQKVYPEKIQINLNKGTALVLGDRITSIQGIKAAGDLRLELTVDSGPRTKSNPWGVYIAKEVEGQ